MATDTLHGRADRANSIVGAFLEAHATDERLENSSASPDSVERRMAQFANQGARHYAMAWGIDNDQHGALVALLAADRLKNLIDGYSMQNERGQQVLTFGIEELYEVRQIKDAMLNVWHHLDAGPHSQFKSLAIDFGLIDNNGNAVD